MEYIRKINQALAKIKQFNEALEAKPKGNTWIINMMDPSDEALENPRLISDRLNASGALFTAYFEARNHLIVSLQALSKTSSETSDETRADFSDYKGLTPQQMQLLNIVDIMHGHEPVVPSGDYEDALRISDAIVEPLGALSTPAIMANLLTAQLEHMFDEVEKGLDGNQHETIVRHDFSKNLQSLYQMTHHALNSSHKEAILEHLNATTAVELALVSLADIGAGAKSTWGEAAFNQLFELGRHYASLKSQALLSKELPNIMKIMDLAHSSSHRAVAEALLSSKGAVSPPISPGSSTTFRDSDSDRSASPGREQDDFGVD